MARIDNLNNFLTDVADSIREKKGTTELIPASAFDTEIDSISGGGGGGEWQPHPDWWDIETILEEDTENFAKVILLIRDLEDTSSLGSISDGVGGIAKMIKTSDGTTYTSREHNISHTWDKTKDKPCSLGYKTRYVIYYYDEYVREFSNSDLAATVLYAVCDTTWQTNSTSAIHIFSNSFDLSYLLEGVKCIGNNIFTGRDGKGVKVYVANNSSNLKSIEGVKVASHITEINTLYTSNCTIEKLTFDNVDCTNITTLPSLSNASKLKHLSGLRNINANFTLTKAMSLTKESLLEIINNLIDLTGQTAKTLTLGKYNLPKLTTEELAIATNKNWTVS